MTDTLTEIAGEKESGPKLGPPVGIFEGTADVGGARPGWTEYRSASEQYRITGGGVDVGGAADAFHFAWRQVFGDGVAAAEVAVVNGTRFPRAKAMLMFRQSLDPGAPYAALVLHGNGRRALQFRQSAGGVTFRAVVFEDHAKRLGIQREGGRFTVMAARTGAELREVGMMVLPVRDPLIAGMGVCAANENGLVTATFRKPRVGNGTLRE